MSVLRKLLFFAGLLYLTTTGVSGAQTVERPNTATSARSNRSGTWAARIGSGLTFSGTWTGVPDSTTTGTVIGTWALVNAQGVTVAGGAWSAAKSPAGWTGAWRAVVSGRNGEYSGTWTASVDLKLDGGFADLFEKAVEAAVSGTWSGAGQSGAWSIRSRPGVKR